LRRVALFTDVFSGFSRRAVLTVDVCTYRLSVALSAVARAYGELAEIAHEIASWIGEARSSLELAQYDFHLLPETAAVVGAGVNGRAVARTFLARGRRVAIWDIDEERARRVALELGAELLKEVKIKKVYIIGQDYSFGHQVSKTAKELLKQKRPDVEIVGDELHPLAKVKDFSPYVAKIQSSSADTLRDAQRVIEAIEALVRIHTAQEEDIYDAVVAQ